jgi:hypothetical protein
MGGGTGSGGDSWGNEVHLRRPGVAEGCCLRVALQAGIPRVADNRHFYLIQIRHFDSSFENFGSGQMIPGSRILDLAK